ncbi:F-box protein [Camellia lanceoleosa]|uniref:F-box protein n=1 Tax=Camellia lanceoleosa TaxID=1840588 RepID=A0ACC0HWX1_9ERIC|nr:F-box protein [Camellia lanceoleosa]
MASSSVQRRQRRRLSVNTTANLTLTAAEKVIGDDDLLSRILIRLPAKPLFRFKTVSKRWCSLISDPYVLQRWIPPKSPSSFFLRRYSRFSHNIKFNHVSLNGLVKHNRSIAPLYLDFFDDRDLVIISKSCNGLMLCTSSWPGLDCCNHCRCYVLNPTTQQYSTIPRPVDGVSRPHSFHQLSI